MLRGRGKREQERHAYFWPSPVGGVGPEGGWGGDVEGVHGGGFVETDGGVEGDEEVGRGWVTG